MKNKKTMENQEIIKAQRAEIQVLQEIPKEAKMGKLPLEQYLPENLVQELLPITRAKISQSMLKFSNSDERMQFAFRVISFINPKFEDDDEDNPLSDFNLAKNELLEFSQNCQITANEFIIALDMATRGLLVLNGDPVKLFREIDRLKLGEVENAYLEFRRSDKLFEEDNKKIKAFLEPPKPEPTPEERKLGRKQFYEVEYARLQRNNKVLGSPIFFDLMKKNGLDKVNLKFIENVLEKFRPEELASISNEPKQVGIPKIIKKNVKVFFIDELVSAYIKKEKLNELSQSEWVDYWENIFNSDEKNNYTKH